MIQVDAQLTRNHLRAIEVINRWGEDYPEHVRKGRTLFESGELAQMRSEGKSTKDVIGRLCELADSM